VNLARKGLPRHHFTCQRLARPCRSHPIGSGRARAPAPGPGGLARENPQFSLNRGRPEPLGLAVEDLGPSPAPPDLAFSCPSAELELMGEQAAGLVDRSTATSLFAQSRYSFRPRPCPLVQVRGTRQNSAHAFTGSISSASPSSDTAARTPHALSSVIRPQQMFGENWPPARLSCANPSRIASARFPARETTSEF